ncbi:Catechol 2,3-dioxygenase [Nocardioides terrae]|uniref:Catechol 2,3-dioxygenase n=1 Tax=Nocardioides terrae TaxID=574651 RepID=A0A1I1GWW7_9ACTN|nr:VOC family protein [Nocardioides terrae]SFC14348.1 Catechol 2,3-dioxygenase [Nocardioides terrae]
MGISLRNVVLDTTDVPRLAEFYRELLGWSYAESADDPDDPDDPDGLGWRTLVGPNGMRIAFQRTESVTPTTWPDAAVPQQLHLDFLVDSVEELEEQHRRATELGAVVRLDRMDDPEEPLRVFTDPAGHTLCLFAWRGQ